MAANGLAVLEAIEEQDYDVIRMDVHMPVMDGIEATRRIRQRRPNGQRSTIIGLTASVKPVQLTDLFETAVPRRMPLPSGSWRRESLTSRPTFRRS